MTEMRPCPSCGAHIPDTAKFCMECGFGITPYDTGKKPDLTAIETDKNALIKRKEEEVINRFKDDIIWAKEEKIPISEHSQPVIIEKTGGKTSVLVCNSCGEILDENVKFCATCGTSVGPIHATTQPVPTPIQSCLACGSPILPGKKFCAECGTPVNAPSTPPPPPPPTPLTCPGCGFPVTPGKKFCGNCGAAIAIAAPYIAESPPPAPVCPKCGSPVTPGKKFCRSCGAPV